MGGKSGLTGVQNLIFQGGTYFAVKYVPGVHIFRKIWTPGTYLGRSKFCVTGHHDAGVWHIAYTGYGKSFCYASLPAIFDRDPP